MSINRYNPVHEDAMVADEEGTHVRYADHVQALVDLAESLGEQHEAALATEREKVAAKFAAFAGPDGEPRKVVRVVEVGKWPSDYVDRIIDPIGPGDVVFICESQAAAEAAKEKK